MLISKDAFVGLDNVTHLCAGGETPMLKSHQQALEQFLEDKGLGEESRARMDAVYRRCQEKVGHLLQVTPENIAFLSSSSEGINLLAHSLSWQPGDNVVVCDVEFPSDVLPWTRLEAQGVTVKIVKHRDWQIHLSDIETAMDARTRVVAISLVSYFTGQRLPLEALSALARQSDALLLVDATHAAGVVPVHAEYADVLVSSCYKWLLGVHGTAVFYWNQARLPGLAPPFLGWNTGAILPDWQAPTRYSLPPTADRFVPGNPSFISLYVLDNALDHLLQIGISAIEAYVLNLSGQVWKGLDEAGWELMTPAEEAQRAGNVCFVAPEVGALTARLAEQGVLIWGSYGGVNRIRVSTHLYNTEVDVTQFLHTLSGR